MKNSIVLLCCFFAILGFSQNKEAYQLFDKDGNKTSYKKLLKASLKTEVVLFGEFHNNAISHWLELELTKDISDKRQIVLGAEMLEADNQKQVNQYLAAEINQKQLGLTSCFVAVAFFILSNISRCHYVQFLYKNYSYLLYHNNTLIYIT